ncbi:glycosyltransferase family 2 protein [Gracilibacillus salinarum]|uniref:Glycosyltransferase family 2 protein n=1 Tax=Gracilibacillus salinarum TaxID=2932255 RepID=A0ABY4GSV1_9BACI|nr:glycosyltransferase family 2 protein [Gracilibacillus salinarum]UOQ87050.1 glycosyltransferase family 2 protein [Gracilibacillus salinarum]
MNTPLVTVFIPVYNCEDYIVETLDSMLNQTYKNLEILLVNDGSTDKSVEVINSFNDPRIKLINNEKNMGIPFSRNVGLTRAAGDYLVIMDSDDISVRTRVEEQVKYMENNPEIDAAGSYYIKFNDSNERKIRPSNFTKPEELKIELMFFNPIANPSAIVRMNTVSKHKLTYSLEHFVSQDYGFWAQLSKVGKISIIPEYLLKYRSGHENITKKSKANKTLKRKAVISSIQLDLLNYYEFNLNNDELEIYHDFFSFNYSSIEQIESIINLVQKIKHFGEASRHFDQATFSYVLEDAVFRGITNQRISLLKKLKLCSSLVKSDKTRRYAYIIIKHVYHTIRRY